MSLRESLHKTFGDIDSSSCLDQESDPSHKTFTEHTERAMTSVSDAMMADPDNIKGPNLQRFRSTNALTGEPITPATPSIAVGVEPSALQTELRRSGLEAHLANRIDVEDAAKTPPAQRVVVHL